VFADGYVRDVSITPLLDTAAFASLCDQAKFGEALSRARERTDVYVSGEDLGEAGTDADLIGRLAERVSVSHAQWASVTRDPVQRDVRVEREREPAAVESRVARVLREQQEREGARGHGYGIE
jgi:hypothetical protein